MSSWGDVKSNQNWKLMVCKNILCNALSKCPKNCKFGRGQLPSKHDFSLTNYLHSWFELFVTSRLQRWWKSLTLNWFVVTWIETVFSAAQDTSTTQEIWRFLLNWIVILLHLYFISVELGLQLYCICIEFHYICTVFLLNLYGMCTVFI